MVQDLAAMLPQSFLGETDGAALGVIGSSAVAHGVAIILALDELSRCDGIDSMSPFPL